MQIGVSALGISEAWMLLFLLVFARVLGLVLICPIFSTNNVPVSVKLGLAAFVSFLLLPVSTAAPQLGTGQLSLAVLGVLMAKEFMLGAILSFAASLLFGALTWAGSVLDSQMGFGFAQMIDPITGVRSAIVAQSLNLVAMLIFLELNGHHILFYALGTSFSVVPTGGIKASAELAEGMSSTWTGMFTLALRLVAPVVIVLLLIDLAQAVVGRMIPQMNVFLVGLPLKIAVGGLVFVIVLPALAAIMSNAFTALSDDLRGLMNLML